jgi:hypothetical protein
MSERRVVGIPPSRERGLSGPAQRVRKAVADRMGGLDRSAHERSAESGRT